MAAAGFIVYHLAWSSLHVLKLYHMLLNHCLISVYKELSNVCKASTNAKAGSSYREPPISSCPITGWVSCLCHMTGQSSLQQSREISELAGVTQRTLLGRGGSNTKWKRPAWLPVLQSRKLPRFTQTNVFRTHFALKIFSTIWNLNNA